MAIVVVSAPFSPLGPAYGANSQTTQQIVDSGLVAFEVLAGLAYTAGTRVRVTSVASGAWMEGIVSTYVGTTLTIAMQLSFGAGFYSDWNINLAGESVVVPNHAGVVSNVFIAESRAANAVTFTLQTLAATDPTINDTVRALFLNGVSRIIAAPISLTIPQGTTLGALNATPFRVWIVLIDDNGTPKLGAFQSRSLGSIFSLPSNGILPTTMVGGGAGQVYCNAPATDCPFVIIGYFNYESGLVTAGNWAVAATRFILFGPGVRLPGQELQSVIIADGTVASGSAAVPLDNTIPQISEGNLFMTRAITPLDPISTFEVYAQAVITGFDSARIVTASLFRADTGNNAIASVWDNFGVVMLAVRSFNASLATKTFTFRAGNDTAVAMGFNGNPGVQFWGGVANSTMRVRELML